MVIVGIAFDMSEDRRAAAFVSELSQFEYVRDRLRSPGENLSIFTKALAVEGKLIDELLKSDFLNDEIVPPAVRVDLQSKKRMEQAEVLIEKISACKEGGIAHFLFFLAVRKPGIVNIIEEGMLARVEEVLETTWKMLQSNEDPTSTLESKKELKMKQEFDSLTESIECKRPIHILCVGKAGVGKSTLANALLGKLATDETSAQTGRGSKVVTKKVEKIGCFHGNIPITFWDTPGPTKTEEDRKCFADIKNELNKEDGKVDLLILCAPAHEARDRPENSIIMKNLTTELGKQIWNNAVIVFAQANLVIDLDKEKTTAAYFHKHCVCEMTERYRKFLVEICGLSPSEAEMVPCVPLGRNVEPYLADGTDWKKNFWMTCIRKASKDISGVLTSSSLTNYQSDQSMSLIDMFRMGLGIIDRVLGSTPDVLVTGFKVAAVMVPGAMLGTEPRRVAVCFAIHLYKHYKAKKQYENMIGDDDDDNQSA